MSEIYERPYGQRAKTWGLEGDVRRLIENTSEHPIMYLALGTQPKTHHPFNLYQDIKIQPQALKETFERNYQLIRELAEYIVEKDYEKIFGHGSGTSQYVMMSAAPAFWEFANMLAITSDSLEILKYPLPLDLSKTLVLNYSGSGSTTDSNKVADYFQHKGAFAIAFTSVSNSPITQKSHKSVVCAGGFDTGGSDTFHYTTRLAASIWLAIEIGALRFPDRRDWKSLREELFSLPDKMSEAFEWISERARLLSARYKDTRSILVVGSGPNLGSAEEIALKIEEMSHIPSKGISPGRHIHGALGLTDHRILTIIIAPLGDKNYSSLRDVSQVTYMLKSPSIGIISEADEQISDLVDDVFRLPEEDPYLFTILAILPGQLLAYWGAIAQGDINPDTQRSNIPRYAKVWNWLFPRETH